MTSTTISWTNGDGAGRLVLIKEGSPVTFVPVDNTTYNADSDLFNLTPESDGSFIIYNGIGDQVSIVNINSYSVYYVKVFEYTGGPGAEQYMTTSASGNPATFNSCTTPVGTPLSLTVCSDEALNINLQNQVISVSASFQWSAAENLNVFGASTTIQSSSFIQDILSSQSTTPEVVTYNVTPVNGACVGSQFNVEVTLNPSPTVDITSNTPIVSSGAATDIQLSNADPKVSFSWTVVPVFEIQGEAAGSGNSIAQTLVNNTGSSQFVSYDIVPYSSVMNCSGSVNSTTVEVLSGPVIPVNSSDSLALVTIYNTNGGANWSNAASWLSTPVRDWEGVIAAGDRVIYLDLFAKGLTGPLSGQVTSLTELEYLDVADNNLTSVPDLSPLTKLTSASIALNRLGFASLESNAQLPFVTYAPQKQLIPTNDNDGDGTGDVDVMLNAPFTLPFTVSGTGNLYQWYLEGVPVANSDTSSLLVLSAKTKDQGIYQLVATNSAAPNISLSGLYRVNVIEPVPAADSIALVDLYNALGGSGWLNKRNWLQDYVDTWEGVTVTNGRVTALYLQNNQLAGVMPASISGLTALQSLFLTYYSGPLTNIGSLTALQSLTIQGELSGGLPSEIGNLTNLTSLILSSCSLTGTIPTSIGNLTQLASLDLGYNFMSGAVPAEILNLTALQSLWLSGNEFTSLPLLSSLTNLSQYDFSDNRLGFDSFESNISILPSIATQKRVGSRTVVSITNAAPIILTFNVGGANNVYEWFKDGVSINSVTGNTLTIATPTVNDVGSYQLIVTNTLISGSIESEFTLVLGDAIQTSTDNMGTIDWSFTLQSINQTSEFEIDDIKAGPDGSVYATGSFRGQFDVDPGAGTTLITSTSTGYDDSFIAKYSNTGTFLSVIKISAGMYSYLQDIVIDNANNVYAIIDNENGANDFIASYDATGTQRWQTPIQQAEPTALHVEGATLYVSTSSTSAVTLLKINTNSGAIDDQKLLSRSSVSQWIEGYIWGLDADAQGNLYLSGELQGSYDFDPSGNTFFIGDPQLEGAVIASFTPALNFRWAKMLTSNADIDGGDVLVSDGGVVVNGSFSGTVDFDPDAGTSILVNSTTNEYGFLAKYNLGGTFQWAKSIESVDNSTDSDFYFGRLSRTNGGDIILAGGVDGVVDLDPSGSTYLVESGSGEHGVVAVYDNLGNLKAGYILASSASESWASAAYQNGSIFVGGELSNGTIDVDPKGSTRLITNPNQNSIGFLFRLNYENLVVNESDSLALVAIYNATGGPNWLNKSNWLVGEIKDWEGVKITNGRVTKLDLTFSNVVGNMPPELANLTELDTLSLPANQLASIPPQLASLTKLRYLDLGGNQLTGSLPLFLFNLTNLRVFGFANNNLSGALPEEIGNLTNLEKLWLDGNQFSGAIPETFSNLVNLKHLFIQNNSFSGDIAPAIVQSLTLEAFSISNNEFTSIPSLAPFTGVFGDISQNFLNFNSLIPNANQPNLTIAPQKVRIPVQPLALKAGKPFSISFDAGGTGTKYAWFKDEVLLADTTSTISKATSAINDTGIYRVVASNTQLPGVDLRLENFQLTVTSVVPDSLALVAIYNATGGPNWTNKSTWLVGEVRNWEGVKVINDRVTKLDLTFSNVVGNMPPELANLTELDTLSMPANKLAAIPAELASLTKLRYLDLGGNELTGTLPAFLFNMPNLRVLGFANNLLSGTLPAEIGNLTTLEYLWLDKNEFSGPLPETLSNLINLKHLFIQNNKFSGDISSVITEALVLDAFSISNNEFTSIPSLVPFTGVFGDISQNFFNFSSLIPNANQPNLTIAPQKVRTPLQPLRVEVGEPFSISFDAGGTGTQYAWFKDEVSIPNQTTSLISKAASTIADNGVYRAVASNTQLPGVELRLENLQLIVTSLVPDSLALVSIYNATGGANWLNKQNWLTSEIRNWEGVKITNGRVTKLDLTVSNVVGNMPPELATLTELDTLAMPGNQLASIPTGIASLTKLRLLDLGGNQLTGTLPAFLFNLSNLRVLGFANNKLSGPLPAEIGNLTNLEKLWLDVNEFSGPLPESISNLVNLKHLFIQNNKFSGAISTTITNALTLEAFSISNNEFTSIPSLAPFTGSFGDISQNFFNFNSLIPNANQPNLTIAPQKTRIPAEPFRIEVGQPFTITFDAGGTGTQYAWFKDEVAVPNQTTSVISKAVSTIADDGVYRAVASNTQLPGVELKLENFALLVSSLRRDSLALVSLFDATGGNNWTNRSNWKTGRVNTWFGITTANNRVTAISLPNNNLAGAVPNAVRDLTTLTSLNLQQNRLRAIPNLTPLTALTTMNVSNNNLDFSTLLPNAGIAGLVYTGQRAIGSVKRTVIDVGQSQKVGIDSKGNGNVYQWRRNDTAIAGATDSTFNIVNIGRANMGDYTVEVKNPALPLLTLTSNPHQVLAAANISGTLFITQGAPASGKATLLRITQGGYDTLSRVDIPASGIFTFNKIVLADYQLVAFADTLIFQRALPTYYKNTIFWEEAATIALENNVDNISIVSQLKPLPITGNGVISGVLEEDIEDTNTGRTKGTKRVAGAGVSARRVQNAGRGKEEVLILVAYVFTDEEGEFTINNLPPAEYRINIQYPGFPMDEKSFLTIPIGNALKSQVIVSALVAEGKINVRQVVITNIYDVQTYKTDVYPNPSNGQVFVRFETPSDARTINIYNVQGRPVATDKSSDMEVNMDLTHLTEGLYFMKVMEKNQVVKILKLTIK